MYELGQRHALEKLGFNLADARKVIKALKPRVVKFRRATETLGPHVSHARPNIILVPKGGQPAVLRRTTDATLREIQEGNKQLNARDMLGIRRAYRADVKERLPALRSPSSWLPEHRITDAAMAQSHEAVESSWLKRLRGDRSTQITTHAHPAPLLNEHNQFATMPEHLRREVMPPLLKAREAAGEVDLFRRVGLAYGEGQRLSPAMRKHYGEKLLQAAKEQRLDSNRVHMDQLLKEMKVPGNSAPRQKELWSEYEDLRALVQ